MYIFDTVLHDMGYNIPIAVSPSFSSPQVVSYTPSPPPVFFSPPPSLRAREFGAIIIIAQLEYVSVMSNSFLHLTPLLS